MTKECPNDAKPEKSTTETRRHGEDEGSFVLETAAEVCALSVFLVQEGPIELRCSDFVILSSFDIPTLDERRHVRHRVTFFERDAGECVEPAGFLAELGE